MRYILLVFALLTLSACASGDYSQYAKAQENIEVAKANAQSTRYKALGEIAKDGDPTSKVAAVMALALGSSQGGGQGTTTLAAPERNQALQWASILVPGLTQIYGIRANADVAMRSSDNAATTSIATTNGFVGLASKIQAPGATYTISGNSGQNSGNATATPTVVDQPAPVIVNPATPVIVTQPPPIIVTQPAPVIVPQSTPTATP